MSSITATKSLNIDVLQRLLRERVTHPECPFCKSNAWAMPLAANSTGVSLPWGSGNDIYLTGSPAVLLTCKGCGFIRLHSLDILTEALETHLNEVGPLRESGE